MDPLQQLGRKLGERHALPLGGKDHGSHHVVALPEGDTLSDQDVGQVTATSV